MTCLDLESQRPSTVRDTSTILAKVFLQTVANLTPAEPSEPGGGAPLASSINRK
jgi:hypothetical protein